jgi:hypothetical protein
MNKIIDFIDVLRQKANQGEVREKTSNHANSGSAGLEKLCSSILEDLDFNDFTKQYLDLKNGTDPDQCWERLGLQNKGQRKKYYDKLKDKILALVPKKQGQLIKDEEDLLPIDDCFLTQPGGGQHPVDLILKYKGYLFFFELKTGGGVMPKYNDRFPSAGTIVIFVSSHQGETMKTGNRIMKEGYPRWLKSGPRKGQQIEEFCDETIPNPFLGDRLRLFFQGDIISISNYPKFDQFNAEMNLLFKQKFESYGFDHTVKDINWRPIMNQSLSNINKDFEANGVNLSCKDREDRVKSYINEV